MRLEIKIYYSKLIINLSAIHFSIRNNQHYHSIHQCSGEMVIVSSLIITFPYNHLIFRPDNFLEWIKYHINLITISNGQWKYLPIQNHYHYIGAQEDSEEMALFINCLTFSHGIFWHLDLRVLWNWNTEYLNQKIK